MERPGIQRWWRVAGGLFGLLIPGWMSAADGWVRHRLIEGSTFLEDCPICDRVSIPSPLRGSFDLRLEETNPLFTRHALRNIDWTTHDAGGGEVRIRGEGELEVGGEVAITQRLRLDVEVSLGGTNIARHFAQELGPVVRPWPNLAADVDAEERTLTQSFRIGLRSAPFRELWFVTANGFTPGIVRGTERGYRPAGDVLSLDGRVVRVNEELTERLGIMPAVPPLALGAFEVMPGGIPMFSLRETVFSETLGGLTPGHVLTGEGRIVGTVEALLKEFGSRPGSVPVPGVDALQVLEDGEVLFSTDADVTTEEGVLGHGDVLGSGGRVLHRFKELMSAFEPVAGQDLAGVGLDALHVWPHGEVWFSVNGGFESGKVGGIGPGDVLSNGGWIVYRNLELLGRFMPLEDLADFGLVGLFAVGDGPGSGRAVEMKVMRDGDVLRLGWSGEARVFQVESATALEGPYRVRSEVMLEREWTVPMTGEAGWYRVVGW